MKVGVIDYGVGNLGSVLRALEELRVAPVLVNRAADMHATDCLILPGVGNFADCARLLDEGGWTTALRDEVLGYGRPLLGVCVGMQMLLDHSEEGDTPSLGLIPGRVRRFDLAGRTQPDGSRYKVPQMGWNQVFPTRPHGVRHPMWEGIPDGAYFYFVHSFYAQPADAAHCAAETDYGGKFASAIARDKIFATQFHPEKSADHGIQLYRNFLHWNP